MYWNNHKVFQKKPSYIWPYKCSQAKAKHQGQQINVPYHNVNAGAKWKTQIKSFQSVQKWILYPNYDQSSTHFSI
jgi:hypothetical protein